MYESVQRFAQYNKDSIKTHLYSIFIITTTIIIISEGTTHGDAMPE